MNLKINGGIFKGTQDKVNRQNERDNKIAYYEKQKESLKDMQSLDIDEIQRKLELYHSYEEQIAAAKSEYNNSQKFHAMDEARERGEKIAEAAKERAPKTKEERKKEAIKEALGIETDDEGLLSKLMDDLDETMYDSLDEQIDEISDSSSNIETDTNIEADTVAAQTNVVVEKPASYVAFNARV